MSMLYSSVYLGNKYIVFKECLLNSISSLLNKLWKSCNVGEIEFIQHMENKGASCAKLPYMYAYQMPTGVP